MDTLSRLDSNIRNHRLSQVAVVSKKAQAVAASTTWRIMRDQVRFGELTADEYDIVMQGLNGAENSEAYDYFFNQGSGTASALISREEFCNPAYEPKHEDYFYNCDHTKIGGDNNGAKIERAYAQSIGKILTPIASSYREARDKPIIKQAVDFVDWALGEVGDLAASIINPILELLGLNDDIERFMVWMTEKVIAFFGAGPILTGIGDHPGLTLTMIAQGDAVTAEDTMRASGAALSNLVSRSHTDQITLAHLEELETDKTFSDRYFATSNPNSLVSRAMYGISSLSAKKVSAAGNWIENMMGNIGSVFSPRVKAQTSVEGAAPFAGIDTYDFPPECLNLEPLEVRLATQLTNADDIYNQAGKPFIDSEDITIGLLSNADAFWAKVYERVEDNDFDPKEVLKVFNCETLDQRVRGSMGYTSGYTADNGLEDGLVNRPDGTILAPGNNIDCSAITGNAKIICAGRNLLGVRYANRNEGTGAKWLNEWGVSRIDGSLGQNPQQWLSERVIGGSNDFMECSGFTRTAIYSAFGVTVNAACSAAYLTDTQYFREIDFSELRPGDLLVESTVCGNGGHIGIFLGITDTGKASTLESSAGRNINTGEKKSGYYERTLGSDYKYAVRYIGPGSSP